MKPELRFEEMTMRTGEPGGDATVPDLQGGLILQNHLEFHLGEEDEIYEGYGRCRNSFPYTQISCYSRKLEERQVKTAVLENDFLRAVFLPEYGGRLWILYDKEQGRNLLYTNDVIRFSNLAVRNAWFSGGVEWNMGVIGHTPFTAAPLFTAVSELDGVPVLRMYEYERIRGAAYQMDFWLGEEDHFLNARMRIVNDSEQVIPMYWWSNIAVPEHPEGRIVVPAEKAYTYRKGGVYKVDIPFVDQRDVTRYQNIPSSVDYFFEIPQEKPKYIAHVDEHGYGLLHLSTSRLQSRKLFSWGHKRAADHWQEFLTEQAGRYVEIQAGLPKTQYGCLPMAPHTAWEWMERYGAVQLSKEELAEDFAGLRERLTERIEHAPVWKSLEQTLVRTKEMAKKRVRFLQAGSGFGALQKEVRSLQGKPEPFPNLDFGDVQKPQSEWLELLRTGKFPEHDSACPPGAYMADKAFFRKLEECMAENEADWYAHYHLGLFYYQREDYKKAKEELHKCIRLEDNPWGCHAMAFTCLALGQREEAAAHMRRGLGMRTSDLSYVKDGFRLLLLCDAYLPLLEIYDLLPEEIQKESRVTFDRIWALEESGDVRLADELLCADGGLILDDVREGEMSLGSLWQEIQRRLGKAEAPVPRQFDFDAV